MPLLPSAMSCHQQPGYWNTNTTSRPALLKVPSPSTRETSYSHTNRLSEDVVRAIFKCLKQEGPMPKNVDFSIIRVGPGGQKLSPPSYVFEFGVYVLLKPEKKLRQKSGELCGPEQVPRSLQHLIWRDYFVESCAWSLSGPQFKQPAGIQQRYCYPKGKDADYCSRTGGALWTLYGPDGKDQAEFRILHVYHSTKRASNKGLSTITPEMSGFNPTKKAKRNKRNSRCTASAPTRSLKSAPEVEEMQSDHQPEPAPTFSSPTSGYQPVPPPPTLFKSSEMLPVEYHAFSHDFPPVVPRSCDVFRDFHHCEQPPVVSDSSYPNPGNTSFLEADTPDTSKSLRATSSEDSFTMRHSPHNIMPLTCGRSQHSCEDLLDHAPKRDPGQSLVSVFLQGEDFLDRLKQVKLGIQELTEGAPDEDRLKLHELVVDWAQSFAENPLGEYPASGKQEDEAEL